MMNISEDKLHDIKISDLKIYNIKIDDILYKPKSEFYKENIFGVDFFGIKKSPNIYVVKSDDVFFDDNKYIIERTNEPTTLHLPIIIIFSFKDVKYTLEEVVITMKNKLFYLECRNWKENYE